MDTANPPAGTPIVFVTATLGTGGAERVLVWLANRFVAAGRQVAIVRLEAPDRPVAYRLDPAVELVSLAEQSDSPDALRGAVANLRRVAAIGRALARLAPAHVVAFGMQTNVLAILAARGRLPVTVAERLHPTLYPAGRIWHRLRDWTYPYANRVVFQTEAARAALSPGLPGVVIANPVLRHAGLASPATPVRYGIVAMGRLTHQKGFDVLIEAVARLPGRHRAERVCILGEGDARGALTALARERGLAGRIDMPGIATDPAPALLEGRIFAMPSRYEGFPNALCEAMALGLPVVASDCPSGPADIVRDGIDGYLVPPDDPQALAEALGRLLDDEALCARMGAAARDVAARFGEDAIFAQWRTIAG